MSLGDEVVLEGGDRDGQPAPFDAMRQVAAGEFVLDDPNGVYRHCTQDPTFFRDGQRRALFEPTSGSR